jgi:hypothetical protein
MTQIQFMCRSLVLFRYNVLHYLYIIIFLVKEMRLDLSTKLLLTQHFLTPIKQNFKNTQMIKNNNQNLNIRTGLYVIQACKCVSFSFNEKQMMYYTTFITHNVGDRLMSE